MKIYVGRNGCKKQNHRFLPLLMTIFLLLRGISSLQNSSDPDIFTVADGHPSISSELSVFTEEACVPELSGTKLHQVNSVSFICFSNSKSRNTFAKLFAVFLILLNCYAAILLFVRFVLRKGSVLSISEILSFIHDQDGKKRLLSL